MESLAEIMARVERLAFAQEEERQIHPDQTVPRLALHQWIVPTIETATSVFIRQSTRQTDE
jgi:hypothetical protein